MEKKKTSVEKMVNKNNKTARNIRDIFVNSIINSPESRMRMEIKEIEEYVTSENKNRRINAPLSTEEKAFLSL